MRDALNVHAPKRATIEAAHRLRLLKGIYYACGAEVAMTVLQCFILIRERDD